MSYRTYVNGVQIFGNNESYTEWMNFIQSQGIEIDSDGCYEGYIKDYQQGENIIENIIMEKEKNIRDFLSKVPEEKKDRVSKWYHSIFDFREVYSEVLEEKDDEFAFSLTDRMKEYIDNGYIFMSVKYREACKEFIELDKGLVPGHAFHYRLKEGVKGIFVVAR